MVASRFFELLTSWSELAQQDPIWAKLRLAIALPTEYYLGAKARGMISEKAFLVEIEELSESEVLELSWRCNFFLPEQFLRELMSVVGGHPYLLRLAFERIRTKGYDFQGFYHEVTEDGGIYRDFLQVCLGGLPRDLPLNELLMSLALDNKPLPLEDTSTNMLIAKGIVKRVKEGVILRYPHLFGIYLVRNLS
jgi:hypothetical protein